MNTTQTTTYPNDDKIDDEYESESLEILVDNIFK